MAYTQTHLLLCATLLGIACSSDVGTRRVPNCITLSIAITGLVAEAMAGGLRGACSGLLAALVVFGLLAPFWAKRIMSGGDVKLGAAAATWVGLARSPHYLLATAVAGTIIAGACYLAATAEARRRFRDNVYALKSRGQPPVGEASGEQTKLVPYGVAFTVGALFALQSGGLVP